MITLILAATLAVSLFLIPFGLPGTWLMIVAAVGADWLGDVQIGVVAIVGTVAIALAAELSDVVLAAKYTRKYGGTQRGAWGAILGGLVGAIVGVPVPVLGSIVGAFVGSFLGALAAEVTGGASHEAASRAATGATIGRAIAMGVKAGAGCVIAAWLLAAAIF